MEIRRIEGEELAAVLSGACRPAVVYFEAENCAACDVGRSALERELPADGNQLEALRFDVWDAHEVVARLRLLSLPTAILFVCGEEVMRLAGVPKRRRMSALFEAARAASNALQMGPTRRSA